MLVKSKDNNSIINVNNVSHINMVTEGISRDYEAVITAYFNNGDEKVLGRYEHKSDGEKKLEAFYRAFHERNLIFDF